MTASDDLVLETDRLILRRLSLADLDALAELYTHSAVRQYIPEGVLTRDETREESATSSRRTPPRAAWPKSSACASSASLSSRTATCPWSTGWNANPDYHRFVAGGTLNHIRSSPSSPVPSALSVDEKGQSRNQIGL